MASCACGAGLAGSTGCWLFPVKGARFVRPVAAGTAAHLVDRVIPAVPVRQWVLSLPYAVRYRVAFDGAINSGSIVKLLLST